jgi:hypothetical protein
MRPDIVYATHQLAKYLSVLENVLKMREERAGETRARAVSRGQMRHRLFLVRVQDAPPPKNVEQVIYKYVDCKRDPNFFKLPTW